jgi:hypothetical protein
MKHSFFFRIFFVCLFVQANLGAQVSIINIAVQPFNLTPEALLNVNVMNNGSEKQARIVTQLYNSSNNILLTVRSGVFKVNKGMNAGGSADRRVESFEFSGADQANYLKTTHNLASGRYKVCSILSIENDPEKMDEFCEELEADFNQYLYLVNPFDGDTVDSKYPILSWTHSEPFSILNQGEFYRMIVSEVKKGQSAEDAMTVNSPVMVKNYLKEHQLQYPYDAKELKEGTKYTWQVQKLSDGVVINKTESWIFNTKRISEVKSLKYVALKNQLDGSYYLANEGLVYFKFSEEYRSRGQLNFNLTDDKSQAVKAEIKKDEGNPENTTLKQSGDNRYELNLNGKKLKSGFYTLEVKNEKNESFYLKIFLP